MSQLPSYTRGLHDLGHGCYAWLQPPGGWGFANSGIIVASHEVLVVDTQNDMRMAAALHTGVEQVCADKPVTTVVNTHSDGDHWNGNLLYRDARIVASEAAVTEMRGHWFKPADIAAMANDVTAIGRFFKWRTKTFDWDGWEPVYPTESFSGERRIGLDDRSLDLVEVGPAHTTGDTFVHVADAGIVYTGDVVFAHSTPITWAGPIARCVEACHRILECEPEIVVPGHGPIVTASGVAEARDYYEFILAYATSQYQAGNTPREAYAGLELGLFAEWPHASRAYQNIYVVYQELEPQTYTAPRRESLEIVIADDDGEWTRDAHSGHTHAD